MRDDLGATLRYFIEAQLVPDGRRVEFHPAVASTRRLLTSTAAEIAVFALAYLVSALSVLSYAHDQIPVWHTSAGIVPGYSAAGWWHVLVSMPLLLVLIFGWLWRLALWARLLWLISRLDLRLIASHPDHVAGLGFVGHSLSAFSIVALALASIAAGRSAHLVLLVARCQRRISCLISAFSYPCWRCSWPAPGFHPDAVSGVAARHHRIRRIGGPGWRSIREQVARARGSVDRAALEKPDFSATADLYSVASNVYAIRFVPVDLKNLIALAVALLLPFGPVVLLAIPVKTILKGLQKLLF